MRDDPMPPDAARTRWSELSSLVDRLLDTPPDARASLLDSLSGGDAARRAELELLRAECEREPSWSSIPVAARFAALLRADARYPAALQERYRLTREIGRGGMATVFLARDVRHARDVAVKIMHPVVASTLGAERFLAEIEMVAQMHHPHIVPLYDSGEADGALYYVMPYESDLSLRHRLAREQRLAPWDVVSVLREMSDALAYAHGRGIVHRDIKPDNVLLSGRHVLLADFGIATAMNGRGRESTSTAALGTVVYMAPEQLAGESRVDHRADIYAMGVLGYELLAGRPPFAGHPRQEHRLGAQPAPLSTLDIGVPPLLDAFVMRCLEPRPTDRWESADRMVRELESITATHADRGAHRTESWRDRWSRVRFERITDFAGSEVDAEISRDGRYVAFLADRDGTFDAFVTELGKGSGEFLNLTRGRYKDLFNEDVRNVGFTPDARHVWIRVAALASPASVSLVPRTGGEARPFLPTAVMAAWSPDGSRLAYHEAAPGDPVFVADAAGDCVRRIHVAPPGVHSHHLSWSPDSRHLYFSHGLPPDEMDIWRKPVDGGQLERITTNRSRVGYPVLLDDRTMLYTATDEDGTGPWLYLMDVRRRVPVRLNVGVEHFLSLSAGAPLRGQARRLVATVSKPSVQLWTVPVTNGVAAEGDAARVSLPTARAAAPRYAADASLLYLASRGGADEVWRRSANDARLLWKPSQGAIAGPAVMSPDGHSICTVVRQHGKSTLHCLRADASGGSWPLAEPLDVRGGPSWSPDGRWIAIGARDGDATHVYMVSVSTGEAVRLVDAISSNPVWSPDGAMVLYSGTPRGRAVSVHAVRPDGTPVRAIFDDLVVDRVGDSYRFLPSVNAVVVKLGGFRQQDFWLIDLASGSRRQLTRLRPGQSLNRFDVAGDGRTILFERAQENSDVVLIELQALRERLQR